MNRLLYVSLAVFLAAALLFLVTVFGIRPSPRGTFAVRPDENTLIFGVTPWGESLEMKEAYRPLLDHLAREVGKRFQLLAIEDYETAIDNIVEGNIDVAVIPPVSYVLAKERDPGLQYISTIVREKGTKRFTTYFGYLVALRSPSSRKTLDSFLAEASRVRIGFVTRQSSSGWAYPMAMLKRRGLDPHRVFKEVKVYDNHPGVTDGLVAGEIDLGATWEYNLEEARKKHGDRFEIVYTTPPIPGLVWVTSSKIPPALAQKIREVQQEIMAHPEIRERLLAATPDKGWQIVDEKFYDEVREIVRYVGTFE